MEIELSKSAGPSRYVSFVGDHDLRRGTNIATINAETTIAIGTTGRFRIRVPYVNLFVS